jgi:hypothetical protein
MAQSSHEIAYEVALRRLDSQLHRVDVIDSKIGVVLGLAGTVLGIFAGFVAVVVDTGEPASIAFAGISGFIVLLVYVAAVIYGLLASATGEWDQRPNWDELLKEAQELELEKMHLWVAEGCVLSLKTNEGKLYRKTETASQATRLALMEAILVAVSLFGLLVVNAAVA